MKKQFTRVLMMVIVISSLLTSMVFAAPLDKPDYISSPGDHGVPSSATTGLKADVAYTTDKSLYNPGDNAVISFTLTALQGDKDGVNKDLLFVLKDTDGSVIYNNPEMNMDSINAFHLAENAPFNLTPTVTYSLAGVSPGDVIELPYSVYDFGNFGSGWEKEMIHSGAVKLKVEKEYKIKIDPTIYVMDDSGNIAVDSNGGFVQAKVDGSELTGSPSNDAVIKANLKKDTTILLKGVPADGYEFVSWLYNINNNLAPTDSEYRPQERSVTVPNKNHTFGPTPVFKKIPVTQPTTTHTVTIVSDPVGVATFTTLLNLEAGETYDVSAETFTLNDASYEFSSFSSNVSGVMGDDHIVVTATFVVKDEPDNKPDPGTDPETEPVSPTPAPAAPTVNYDLTVSATEGGTVPGFMGTSTFGSGTIVNLSVTAEEGYEFTGWSGPVEGDQVTMTSDKSVTANFELIVEEEPIPEAPVEEPAEEVEEILDEAITESAPSDVIEDEALPQTGGIPMSAMSMMGLALSGLGFKLRKKK